MPKMPFLFMVESANKAIRYLVVIAEQHDWKYYSHKWWGDDQLKFEKLYQTDVDIEAERHWFDTQSEALTFLQNWWSKQQL